METQAPRRSVEAMALSEAFEFSHEDLEANRQGRLSQRQHENLRRLYRIQLGQTMALLLVMLIVALFAQWVLLRLADTSGTYWIPIALYSVILVVLFFFIRMPLTILRTLPDFQRFLGAGKVYPLTTQIQRGEVRTRSIGGSAPQLQPEYVVYIGEQEYIIPEKLYGVLDDEASYRLYLVNVRDIHIPRLGILSLERVNLRESPMIRQDMNPENTPFQEASTKLETEEIEGFTDKHENEIFISYSRTDKVFVDALVEALRQQGLDPWYDVEDIPKTAIWWESIQQGIVATNAFVFIVSPDSLCSEVCNWELQYAIQHSKKIIPILFKDVFHDTTLHDHLKGLTFQTPETELVSPIENWERLRSINFIQPDTTQTAHNIAIELVTVARTDLRYVEQHTRLLRRAVEWYEAGQLNDFLLFGTELENAEAWLQSAAERQPAPDKLHRLYIQQSRAVERKRKHAEREREAHAQDQETKAVRFRQQAATYRGQAATAEARYNQISRTRVWPIYLITGVLGIIILIAALNSDNSPRSSRVIIVTQPSPWSSLSYPPSFNPNIASHVQTQANLSSETPTTPMRDVQILRPGEQIGRIHTDGKQHWAYQGNVGQSLNISILTTSELRLIWQDKEGNVLRVSNSTEPLQVSLRETGTYTLLVEGTEDALYILAMTVE